MVAFMADVYAVPALFLGGITGRIGQAQHIFDGIFFADRHDPDADANRETTCPPVETESLDCLAHFVGEIPGLFDVAMLHQNREFIAAQPGQCVA